MVGLSLFLGRTAYGVQMRAAAEDFRMARYLGHQGEFRHWPGFRHLGRAGRHDRAAVRVADRHAQAT